MNLCKKSHAYKAHDDSLLKNNADETLKGLSHQFESGKTWYGWKEQK
jgi:hypothetical protein